MVCLGLRVLLSGVVYMLVLLPFFVIQYLVTPWLDHRRATRAQYEARNPHLEGDMP